jgi:DeoR family fructose operon transcriptional repressor
MQAAKRQQKILDTVQERGIVSVTELADEFGVSQNTIRADLNTLAEQGLLIRTHGGASLPKPALSPQLWPAVASLSPGAKHIVDYALSWIENGDSLILDGSALCTLLAERMAGRRRLRVITNNLAAACILSKEPSNTVVIAGGELDHAIPSTRGRMAQLAIEDFRADKAFLSCTGVSAQSGLTEVSSENAGIKRAIKRAADSVFVLVESDRIAKTDLFPVAELTEPRRIMTDEGGNLANVQALVDKGARVTLCRSDGHETLRSKRFLKRVARIGFANHSHGIWFASSVWRGLEQAAGNTEGVELLVVDNQNSVETAVQNVDHLLKQDIDLLIEYEGTGEAGRLIMRKMLVADVPVIAVDIPITAATYFGCDHDAVGVVAGQELARWVRDRWNGAVDEILLITCTGGGVQQGNGGVRVQDWTGGALPSRLAPAMRLDAALDALQSSLGPVSHVRRMVVQGDWHSSADAVPMYRELLAQTVAAIPRGHRVCVVCLVDEVALGLTQAVRAAHRCDQVVVVSFGGDLDALHAELLLPDTCLLGTVDLHPERYGSRLLETALRLLSGEAVPPAVFVEPDFLSREDVRRR